MNLLELPFIKLDQTIIPSVPFLWYREEQLVCPIEHIYKNYSKNIKYLTSGIDLQDEEEIFIVIQRNVLDNANIYVCLHSFMYYILNKDSKENILVIPSNYNLNIQFKVKTIKIKEFIEINGGLRNGEAVTGPVYIHNCSFSPPGCFHFKIAKDQDYSIFLCHINCDELNVNSRCLFVLINDIDNNCDVSELIDDLIKKVD